MLLQYTEKGILPLSPVLPPTAVSGYIPPFSASAVYPHNGTKAKEEETRKIATSFPATRLGDEPENDQGAMYKRPERSLSFPVSNVTSGVTDASVWTPVKLKRSETLQTDSTKAGRISLESWETRAGIVNEGNMVKFPKFGKGEEE
jgi:hypothetical protein